MIKPLFAFSIACAGALAFADNPQWQSPRFTGIGSGVTSLSDLNTKAVNGSWNVASSGLTADNAAIESGKLVLDLEDDELASFSISPNAADTNTLQTIVIKAIFTPVVPTDIPTGASLNENTAQVGFAIVNTSDTIYKYYAWVGSTDGAAATNDWIELTGATPSVSAETDLQIEIDHWTSTPKATFKVKSGDNYVTLASAASSATTSFEITSTQKSAEVVSSVACSGSGTVSALTGDVQLGVASIGTQKYPTADAAVDAAESGQTVELTRDLVGDVAQAPGSVTAKDGVKIADNGHSAAIDTTQLPTDSKVEITPKSSDITSQSNAGKSGTYVINTTVATDKLQITLPSDIAAVKQVKDGSFTTVVGGGVQYELETADACIPGSASNRSKMRAFLNSQRNEAYISAESTSANINSALGAKSDSNGLTYQQCYELGVSATDSIAPVAMTSSDTDSANICLSIPKIGTQSAWSGAYTITYSVKDANDTVKASGLSSPMIPLSLGSGSFKVIAVTSEKTE